MGEDRQIPHISLTIDETQITEGALKVLAEIRPQWNQEEIEFKLLTDGITNKLVGCRHKDADAAETVLVRIYGNKTDLLIDRKAETRNILLLSKFGLTPGLFATFKNGLAYQFVPGCTLTAAMVTKPQIYQLVATRMAKLHKVQVPGVTNPQPFVWDKIQRFIDLVPDEFSDPNKNKRFREFELSKHLLKTELAYLKEFLSDSKSPVVFCHNDLLLGNVVYTEENNTVTFIDYEYSAHNYQAFDIANHFLEFAGVDQVDYSKYPNKEFQLEWFKVYLKEFQGDFSDEDVGNLYRQVRKFVLVSHMLWGTWALIQTEHSYIDFDFLKYANIRFKQYFLNKEELILSNELPR